MAAIVCPWCGTNYTVFQSNCRNCGGTIPAPTETVAARPAKRAKPGELQFPAPPPREVAPNYVWKLFAQDGWVISGGIFALIGGIFTVTGAGLTVGIITAFVGLPFMALGLLFLGGGGGVLYWRYQLAQKAANVLRLGQATQGEITALEPNYSVRINGRTPWTIRYTFSLDGTSYEGSHSTLNDPSWTLQPGTPAVVLYLPDKPESNQLYPHP
jgi:hypothetical protein